ncbi:uncharacterized protein LOC134177205 isoform X2 [Corticium candelabrum]|uniref:uncharacterized protein LOC134177205 isoform X2 n=1 Tax=Corticium candelabrum TaxID=121492 RepID=UPI002E25C7D0|nr:uncharacterized protein LOC134177205 isoform X2 [Corticium candelabrum]
MVQPACVSCLVRLTNRVTSITVSDVNKKMLTHQVKFHAGANFPDVLVTVETEDGLVADIDWHDMNIIACSPKGHKFQFQLIETRYHVAKYSCIGSDTLTEVGFYQVVAQLNDQRQDLRELYPASHLQIENVGHIAVLPGNVDRLLVTFPNGFGRGRRRIVISRSTTQNVTLLPCQTLTSAVDAYGNVVDNFSGSLRFALLQDDVPFTLTACMSHGVTLETNFSEMVIDCGHAVLTSPVKLKLSEEEVVPGQYFLFVYSTDCNRVVHGSVAVTVTAVETESIVRELQDCEEKKQQLEEDVRCAESMLFEVEGYVTAIRSRLRELACVDMVDRITASNVERYIQDVELKYSELEKKKFRKPEAPKDLLWLQLPASLQAVVHGQLVDLAFVEEESYSRLISSHLGERLLSSVIFPTSEHVEKYEQAPHENFPPAASLDISSQVIRESIKEDLIEIEVGLSWELAIERVSSHDSGVQCLMCCLLKDTLITNSLADAKQLLSICQNGNDLRAVPDILSIDGYRVTPAGFVERLVDGPAESKYVFGQEPIKLSHLYKELKKAVELLKQMDDKLKELEVRKRQHTDMIEKTKPLLGKLEEEIIKLRSQKHEVEQSAEHY